MGSPLFISAPLRAPVIVPTLTGGALDPVDDATLLFTAAGPTLIESILYAQDQAVIDNLATSEGQIAIVQYDGSTIRYVERWVKIEARAADPPALTGSIDVGIALPSGWSIYLSHNLVETLGTIDIDLSCTAVGGVLS